MIYKKQDKMTAYACLFVLFYIYTIKLSYSVTSLSKKLMNLLV